MRAPGPDQRARGSPLNAGPGLRRPGHRPWGCEPETSCPTFVRRSLSRFGTVVSASPFGDIAVARSPFSPRAAHSPQRAPLGIGAQHGRSWPSNEVELGPARCDRGETGAGVPAHRGSRVRGLGCGREGRQGDARELRSVDRASCAMPVPARDEIEHSPARPAARCRPNATRRAFER